MIISSENEKYALCRGTIIELNPKFIKFASYKPIKDLSQFCAHHNIHRDAHMRYRVDMDDSAYGFSALRANIFFYFLSPTPQNKNELIAQKRKMLVDLVPPRFEKECKIEIPSHLESAYNALNIDQQNAIDHVLKCKDYALILGMPGTGKSATIIFLLRLLVSLGFKVLLSAYTNSAIDHLCLKLLKYADVREKLIRIGSLLSINSKLLPYTLNEKDKNKFDCISSIDSFLRSKQIYAVTSISSASHCIFGGDALGIFDYCIIDEAGQLTEPQSLAPLRKCRKFILVGDQNQLPPLVQCKEAGMRGMNRSLFEKLVKKHTVTAVKALTIQYRMNSDILLLSNCLIYDGAMQCASDSVATQSIKLNCNEFEEMDEWLKNAVDPHKNVILFNTDRLFDEKDENRKKNINEHEANMIERIVDALFKFGLYSSQIGVMAPYRSQLKLIKTKLDGLNVPLSPSQIVREEDDEKNERESSLLLDTIDRFQGSDRDVIIISFTHSPFDKKLGSILNDWRRINVALTRAKCKLILIASQTALKNSNSAVLKKLIDIASKEKWIFDIDSY